MIPTPHNKHAYFFRFLARYSFLFGLSLAAFPTSSGERGYVTKADRGEGFHFWHHDWEMACDNTRTCRAAGYHSETDELGISILLTRKAGPNAAVSGEVMIGQYGESPVTDNLPKNFTLWLYINQQRIGGVKVERSSLTAKIPTSLLRPLLVAISGNSQIEWVHGSDRWHLSGQGATATLLKMDEFQGRIDTPGALIKKGDKSEYAVRPDLPLPVLIKPALPKPQPGDATFAEGYKAELIKTLRNNLTEKTKGIPSKDPYCPDLLSTESESSPESDEFNPEPELTSLRLSDTKMLVSVFCWRAAYNAGYGHWVVNDKPPFDPILITTLENNDSGDGILSAAQKSRGLGDCWSHEDWTWDGTNFVHTHSSSTGMCRLMAPGGAWSLPTLVTNIQQAKSNRLAK